MKEKKIKSVIDLALGDYEATSNSCDLIYDYVRINAEYSTYI
jgi:N-acetylglutamate synthase/N-acetylornithine aminotransferase